MLVEYVKENDYASSHDPSYHTDTLVFYST